VKSDAATVEGSLVGAPGGDRRIVLAVRETIVAALVAATRRR
jgi:hypothetical protein